MTLNVSPAAETPASLFRVRDGRLEDLPFVRSCWLMSDRRSLAARDDGPGYMGRHKARIGALLARPSTRLAVACTAEDDNAIVGFACVGVGMTPERVYYVYVRPDAREIGLARAMLSSVLHGLTHIECTHRPTPNRALPSGWTYCRDANHPRHDS